MPYVKVWVDDARVDEIVADYGEADWEDFVGTHREKVVQALGAEAVPEVVYALDDPMKRLEVITALRNQGYKVEPA
jgi:hypothetical protein